MALDVNLIIKTNGASGLNSFGTNGGGSASVYSAMQRMNQQSRSGGGQPAVVSAVLKRVQSMITSSRHAAGGGMVNAVSKIAPLFEKELLTAIGAVSAFALAAKQAADNLNPFRRAMITGGGTSLETARLGSLGIGTQNAAELARAFTDRIAAGGLAAGVAGQYGITHSGPFDNQDSTAKLLLAVQKLDALGDAGKRSQAIFFARSTGLESLLGRLDLSKARRLEMDKSATFTAKVMTPERMRLAADFNASLGLAGDAFNRIATILGSRFLPLAIRGLDAITGLLDRVSSFLELPAVQKMLDAVGLTQAGGAMAGRKAEDLVSGHNSALDKNTDAIDKLSQVVQGIHGGGSQARGALPSELLGNMGNRGAVMAVRLGAFSLTG